LHTFLLLLGNYLIIFGGLLLSADVFLGRKRLVLVERWIRQEFLWMRFGDVYHSSLSSVIFKLLSLPTKLFFFLGRRLLNKHDRDTIPPFVSTTSMGKQLKLIREKKDALFFFMDIGSTEGDWKRLKIRRLKPYAYIYVAPDYDWALVVGVPPTLKEIEERSVERVITSLDLVNPATVLATVGNEPSPCDNLIYVYVEPFVKPLFGTKPFRVPGNPLFSPLLDKQINRASQLGIMFSNQLRAGANRRKQDNAHA
jgi:hypothetical protein